MFTNFCKHHLTASIVTLILLLVGVTACSVNPATGERHFTAFMSPEDEERVGYEEHPKIIKQFGGVYDQVDLSGYVAQIGASLAKVSELPDLKFHFTVLNSNEVNAFALPGGYVYVTRGLLALAENEAELAGVIAHEIGHVTARHTAQRYSQAMATNIGLSIVSIIGSIYGAPRETTQFLSVGAEAILGGYSRQQELEADLLAVRYLGRAGYDVDALSTFFKKMKVADELRAKITHQPTSEDLFNFRSSHPRTSDRISQAVFLAQGNKSHLEEINRNRFLDHIDGMLFGEDPREGIRKGRNFIHPVLNFKFTVPKGFVITNTPTNIISRHKNGSIIVFDMEPDKEKAKINTDLHHYLTEVWGQRVKLTNIEKLNINGMNAWTGNLRSNTQKGPRDIRLIAIRGYEKDKIFRIVFLTPVDKYEEMSIELKRMTYSFKRLSAVEAKAVKPLKIQIVQTLSGETPQTLSENMEMDAFNLEWFNLINANNLKDIFPKGNSVKLIRE